MAIAGASRGEVDFLSLLSEASRHRLMRGSRPALYKPGTLAFNAGDPPVLYLVEHGLVRIFWSLPDGRQATVAYLHSNDLLGGSTVIGHPQSSSSAQVVVESTLRLLDQATAKDAAEHDIQITLAVATHLATQLHHAFRLIAVRSLGTISQRLAYDLLDRACRCQLDSGRLEARVTHGGLADSIGSSREVVSRALRAFRDAGIVETAPGVTRVVKPMELARTVRAFIA